VNPDIGYVKCPFTGERAAVRRYKTGRRLLYFVSPVGIIRPNTAAGQEWMLEHAHLFTPDEHPDLAARRAPPDPEPAASSPPGEPTPADPEPEPDLLEAI